MIPEHRLTVLLDEVKDGWISNCLYHNTTASPSLYLDHNCERDDFPTKPVLELKNHKDEVWFLQYSNDGSMLASSSKDTTVYIYDTKTYRVMQHLHEHHGSGVTHLAWSPDDTKIITCCAQPENSARIWDVVVCLCAYCNDSAADCIRPVNACNTLTPLHTPAQQRPGRPLESKSSSAPKTTKSAAASGISKATKSTTFAKTAQNYVPTTSPFLPTASGSSS